MGLVTQSLPMRALMVRSNLPEQTLGRSREQRRLPPERRGQLFRLPCWGLFLDLRRSGRSGNSEVVLHHCDER